MSNRLLIKKSSIAAKTPLATDLEYGELAINYTDEKIYFKNASNVVKSFNSFVLGLSSPSAIGNTTPAAGTFTTLIGGGGSVNYAQLTGAITSSGPILSSQGSDTNIDLNLTAKGTGGVKVTNAITSSSITTGSLVVAGGVGVSGDIWANNMVVGSTKYIYFGGITGTRITRDGGLNGMSLQTANLSRLFISDAGTVALTSTAASTSTATGALQVAGGIGAAGSVYTGNRVGFVNASNVSTVYQYYNATTNSLDTVFG